MAFCYRFLESAPRIRQEQHQHRQQNRHEYRQIDAGMDGHIAKPINIEDLFVVLTDILNKQKS